MATLVHSSKVNGWRRLQRTGARLWVVSSLLGASYLGAVAALAGALCLGHPKSDVIVVLGNALTPDGRPSARLCARLGTALSLYRRGLAPRVLVSGGFEQGRGDEAQAMADYLLARGVPAAAVGQDAEGDDTWATARHTAALVGVHGHVIVVTQWFHLPRTVLAMRRFGLRSVSAAAPPFFEARDVYSFLREAVALPVYALRPMRSGVVAKPSRRTTLGRRRPGPARPA